MQRKVARQKKPATSWSFATILYLVSASLCVSYPLLAPISEWVQGSHAPLQCYKSADKLIQLYYTDLSHVQTHGNGFLDKLRSCDAFSPALPPISKQRKVTHLKKINVRGFFISLFTFISSAGSAVFSFSLLLFALGTMNLTLSLFVIVSLCTTLVVVQWKLLYNVIHVVGLEGNHRERACVHKHVLFWKNFVVCITVYAKVCFSRAIFNLRTLISARLLMSGDVETNPGPPADNPPKRHANSGDKSSSPTLSHLSHSSSTSNLESVHQSNGELPYSFSHAIATTDEVDLDPSSKFLKPVSEEGDLSVEESTARKQEIMTDDSLSQKHTTNACILPENVSGKVETELSLVAENWPKLNVKHEEAKSRLVPPPLPQKVAQSETHTSVQVKDEQKKDFFVHLPPPQRTVHPDDLVKPKYQYLKEDQVHSFCEANKCYRNDEEYKVSRMDGTTFYKCALCHSEKKTICKSHIIPNCIFKVFQEVHNHASVRTQTVYVADRHKVIYTKSLTQKILCDTCEQNSSPSENKLKRLYIDILALKHERKHFYYKDDDEWLWYILANIMFRGLLVNVDLTDELFQNEEFEKAFFNLWMYCKQSDSSKRPDKPNLRVFLYPDRKKFKEECTSLVYPFELLIRLPHYTEIISCKETGPFLYTKFDCFHVVLPIGKTVFQQYKNGLVLRKFDGDTHTTGILSLAGLPQTGPFKRTVDTRLPCSFPTELMEWNLQLYGCYLPLVWNNPRVHCSCQFIMVKSHNVSDLIDYMCQETSEYILCCNDDPPKPKTEEVHKHEGDKHAKIDEARNHSPLRWASDLRMTVKEQWAQIRILEKQVEELSCENDELQDEHHNIASEIAIGYRYMQFDSTHVVETMKLKERITRFITECKRMKTQHHIKEALQEQSSKEIQQLKYEQAQQRKFHLNLITRPPPRRHSSLTEDDVKIVTNGIEEHTTCAQVHRSYSI